MNPRHVSLLVDPKTHSPLQLEPWEVVDGRVRTGELLEPQSDARYPITEFIPRFVPPDNYASTFGFQWNAHSRTQNDQYSGLDASRERFQKETRWGEELLGLRILEVGSGAGRFTSHALATGATVVSFDYSRAVDANYRINGGHDNLLLLQADIYNMPLPTGSFDRVSVLGVLQHTPDPERAFGCCVEQLRPGGWIACDIYRKSWLYSTLFTKYWVRPFTSGRDPEKLYRCVCRYVEMMWPLARLIRKIPRIGYMINWQLLVADHSAYLHGAPDHVLKEWAVLDTFDMLSPKFDFPQTLAEFQRWFLKHGLEEIDVHYGYNGIEGRGRRKLA